MMKRVTESFLLDSFSQSTVIQSGATGVPMMSRFLS